MLAKMAKFLRKKIFIILNIFSLIVAIVLLVNFFVLSFKVSHCAAIIRVFESVVEDALKENRLAEINKDYDCIKNHYVSGTIQTPGSHLDYVVETARKNALDRIAARLQKLEAK